MEADGEIKETKSGNRSAKKKQTLNYIDISKVLYNNAPVQILYATAARAAQEIPHVANWGAVAVHEQCP